MRRYSYLHACELLKFILPGTGRLLKSARTGGHIGSRPPAGNRCVLQCAYRAYDKEGEHWVPLPTRPIGGHHVEGQVVRQRPGR